MYSLGRVMQIENNRLIVRSLTKDDIDGIISIRNDEKVYEYEPSFLIERQGSIEEAIDKISNMDLFRDKQCILGVYEKDNPAQLVGIAEFYDYKASGMIVSIGYRFLSQYWHKGLGSSCVNALLYYLRNNTQVRIVTAHVLPINKGSSKCLEKNGFEYLITKKEDWGHGELEDTDVYVIDC